MKMTLFTQTTPPPRQISEGKIRTLELPSLAPSESAVTELDKTHEKTAKRHGMFCAVLRPVVYLLFHQKPPGPNYHINGLFIYQPAKKHLR